jgi:GxxExxY protein
MDINELTYQINGAIFEVSKLLGAGFLEKVYENALIMELRSRGIKALSQFPIAVKYKGKNVGANQRAFSICNSQIYVGINI